MLKKLLASALVLTLVAGAAPIPQLSDLFGSTVITASAQDLSKCLMYLDENGEPAVVSSSEYSFITGSEETFTTGTYVLNSSVNYRHRPQIIGDVVFILCDDSSATFKGGINVPEGSSFTIYAQSTGYRKSKLIADANSHNAAIGGNDGQNSGDITICGGEITANASEGAGIGGGNGGNSGAITIYGGDITAMGGFSAAIGGGYNASATVTKIYGGNVTAIGNSYNRSGATIGGGVRGSGGTIEINGGVINASGKNGGAGIGGGYEGDSGNITINGGIVKASGESGGAGIGGGVYCSGVNITINGGVITAFGDSGGSGIGGGSFGTGGNITINGGDITATGGYNSAAIGGGIESSGGHITINDGRVTVNNDGLGAGIGGGESGPAGTIEIKGGEINANIKGNGTNYGAGIGAGFESSGGTVSLSYSKGTDYVSVSSFKNAAVTIDTDTTLTDADGNTYTSETPSETLGALTNVMLYPAGSLPVNVSETQKGTVKAPKRACPGEVVTLTTTSDCGYDVETITLNGTELVPEDGVYTFTMPDTEADISATFAPQFTVSEDGNTYTIYTSKGWDIFRECMEDESYNGFDDKTVVLANDIFVTKPASSEGYGFKGYFEGNGKTLTVDFTAVGEFCAPFPWVDEDAFFYNLTVNGTINTDYGYAAGLIGHMDDSVTIQSCCSNIVINSTAGAAGGFVGLSEDDIFIRDCVSSAVIRSSGGNNSGFIAWTRSKGKRINIEGCLFDGKIIKNDSTSGYNGGFIGWKGDAKKATLSHCVYDPTYLEENEYYASDNSAIFSRQHAGYEATLINCYYFDDFGSEQGLEGHSIYGMDVNVEAEGEPIVYPTSGITGYRNNSCLKYKGFIRAGEGDNVSLSLDYAEMLSDDQFIDGYSASAGTLEDSVLTMPDEEVYISADFLTSDECLFDEETGTLTLRGNVSVNDVWKYIDETKKVVVAESGCVLPNSCACLFESFYNVISIDLTGADASKVRSMSRMFINCSSLTELKFGDINTKNVTRMDEMFYGCSSLESLDVSTLDTGNVSEMSDMFNYCSALKSLDVSNFDMSNVQNSAYMFYGCSSLESLVLGDQNTRRDRDMSGMLALCSKLESLDVTGLDTSAALGIYGMFQDCNTLKSLDLSSFDTTHVSNMGKMFKYCSSLKKITFGTDFNTSSVTNMSEMFSDCNNLSNLDLSGFDTSKVTDMSYMFFECSDLSSVDLGSFDTGKVEKMHFMFYNCSSLQTLDLSSFDTSKVTDMSYMFNRCSSLGVLDISGFDTGMLTNIEGMFIMASSSMT